MAMRKIKGEVASVFKGEYVSAYMDVQYYMVCWCFSRSCHYN